MNKTTSDAKVYMVTGVTGFLGNRIVKMLLEEGKRVRVFVRQGDPDDRVDVVKGDLMDLDSIRRSVKGSNVVFHTTSFISWNPNDNDKLNRINIKANQDIIDACKEFNVSKLIYTSSIDAIYEGKPIKDGDARL